jgi:hypothetical protein
MSEAVFVVARGIIEKIVRGDDRLLPWLREQTSARILLPYSCVVEGLALVNTATCSGIHELARLLCSCELVLRAGRQVDESLPTMVLTPDVLLSCLVGNVSADTLRRVAKQANMKTYDAVLVGALLSTEPGDKLAPGNLAGALEVIHMNFVDPATTCRAEWPSQLSREYIGQIRRKVAEGWWGSTRSE